MPRPRKFTPATADALRGGDKVPLASAIEATADIVVIPGFEAETVNFAPSLPGIKFVDNHGRQVVVKLNKTGLLQWRTMTRS